MFICHQNTQKFIFSVFWWKRGREYLSSSSEFFYVIQIESKQTDVSPDGKWLPPPVVTVTHALLLSSYFESLTLGRQEKRGTGLLYLKHSVKCNKKIISAFMWYPFNSINHDSPIITCNHLVWKKIRLRSYG